MVTADARTKRWSFPGALLLLKSPAPFRTSSSLSRFWTWLPASRTPTLTLAARNVCTPTYSCKTMSPAFHVVPTPRTSHACGTTTRGACSAGACARVRSVNLCVQVSRAYQTTTNDSLLPANLVYSHVWREVGTSNTNFDMKFTFRSVRCGRLRSHFCSIEEEHSWLSECCPQFKSRCDVEHWRW